MFQLLLVLLALVMIWVQWGFKVFALAIVAKLILEGVFKPEDKLGLNRGMLIANVVIIIAGIIAIHNTWQEPAFTSAATIIAVMMCIHVFKN